MKRPSSLVPDSLPADHVPCEQSSGNRLTRLPKAAPYHSQQQQDFAQLLARYKRVVYEASERWNQDRRAAD